MVNDSSNIKNAPQIIENYFKKKIKKKKRTTYDVEIHVLILNRHIKVAGLNLSMGSQHSPF